MTNEQGTVDNLAVEVMREIKRLRTPDFAGIGVVFYKLPLEIPIASLGRFGTAKPTLPVHGTYEIARTLALISDRASPWHDGFHLIEVTSLALTHIAQFLAPPLDSVPDIAIDAQPTGARQMTALLTSRLPGVISVALLSSPGEISIYSSRALDMPLINTYE